MWIKKPIISIDSPIVLDLVNKACEAYLFPNNSYLFMHLQNISRKRKPVCDWAAFQEHCLTCTLLSKAKLRLDLHLSKIPIVDLFCP